MKNLTILLALLVGCSADGEIDTGTHPSDAGDDSSSSTSSSSSSSSGSGKNCNPILWSYGEDRFCEECTCPGTECRTRALGEELVVGVCGEDLTCSAVCKDPLWIEMHGD